MLLYRLSLMLYSLITLSLPTTGLPTCDRVTPHYFLCQKLK